MEQQPPEQDVANEEGPKVRGEMHMMLFEDGSYRIDAAVHDLALSVGLLGIANALLTENVVRNVHKMRVAMSQKPVKKSFWDRSKEAFAARRAAADLKKKRETEAEAQKASATQPAAVEGPKPTA